MTPRTSQEVWACVSEGDRAGDLDQVAAIAWALDPQYLCVDLTAEYERLRDAGGAALPPRAIVGIGRKRQAMARAIKQYSGGATRLIHLGRDRGGLADLDCLVTTPAFPMPKSPKVLSLEIALSDRIRRWQAGEASAPAAVSRIAAGLLSRGIRRPWINVFLGAAPRGRAAQKKDLRRLAARLDSLARQHDRDLVITGSPRTASAQYDDLDGALESRRFLYRWRAQDGDNPFEAMLGGSDLSVVTADSITMISQIVAAGHRLLVFPWREEPAGVKHLIKRALVGRKTRAKDLAAFCAGLYGQGLAAPLDGHAGFADLAPRPDLLDRLFQRLRDTVDGLGAPASL